MALIPDSDAKDQAIAFMKYIAGPEGQAVYTKEIHAPADAECAARRTHRSTTHQHKLFLDLLPTAHNRPPLAVGAAYWDALTTAQGSVELNTKQPQAALQEVAGRRPAAARRRRLLTNRNRQNRGDRASVPAMQFSLAFRDGR